jgi:hypothetical protein
MANITPPTLTKPAGATIAGITPTVVTPAGGGDNVFLVGNGLHFRFITSSATTPTVTLNSIRPSDQGTDVDPVQTLPATGVREFILPASEYGRYADANNSVGLTYSSVTGLTFEVKALP